jgi:hypothetical protein
MNTINLDIHASAKLPAKLSVTGETTNTFALYTPELLYKDNPAVQLGSYERQTEASVECEWSIELW